MRARARLAGWIMLWVLVMWIALGLWMLHLRLRSLERFLLDPDIQRRVERAE